MNVHSHSLYLKPALIALALAAFATSCTTVGPLTISSGRLAYNEAIAETNNQQMLMVLVHNRYEESSNMLAVASVTANVSVRSSAGIQAGFGGDSNYQGNLVPFAGGVIYEENPTISYTPIAGEKYLRRLTVPLPIAMVAQITRTMKDPRSALVALISSANGIYNPDFIYTPHDNDPRFDRFVDIMAELTRKHRLSWVENTSGSGEFSILIDQSAPDHTAMVKELLALLGLSGRYSESENIVIPVVLSLDAAAEGAIGMSTRSVFDLVEILTARVQIPPIDVENGVASEYPPAGRLGQDLVVHFSESEPEHAYIAVAYRSGWFYIDERDRVTKAYFKLLGGLWSLAVSSAMSDGPAAPVLTVPVSN